MGADAAASPGPVTSKDYFYTRTTSIPFSLRARSVEKCSLEFIRYKESINHCIIRLTFKHVQVAENDWAPAGTRGVLIDCQFLSKPSIPVSKADIPEGIAHVAKIRIQTFNYAGPHRRAAKVVDIPVKKKRGRKGDRRVWDFLRTIQEAGMSPVAFTNADDVHGCRDWTSQLIHRWSLAKIVELGATWAECFNFVYWKDDQERPRLVKQAAFVAGYERLVVPGVDYVKDYDPRIDPQLIDEELQHEKDDCSDNE